MQNPNHQTLISGTLPVLHWDDFTMGQTEAIAGYLYHKLGHSDGMTLEDAAKSAALVSVSHQVLSPQNLTTLEGIPKPQTLICRLWISSSGSQSKSRKMPKIQLQLAESSLNPVLYTLYPALYPKLI